MGFLCDDNDSMMQSMECNGKTFVRIGCTWLRLVVPHVCVFVCVSPSEAKTCGGGHKLCNARHVLHLTLSFLLFLTELALKLTEKKQIDYSIVIHWLRAKPSFNLLMKISSVVSKRLQINLAKHELNTDFSGDRNCKCDRKDEIDMKSSV